VDQPQEPPPGGPVPTVPAASDAEAFTQWRADMRAYATGLIDSARLMEETAIQSRARAAVTRQIGTDLHRVLDNLELPKRTPGAALHEKLLDEAVSAYHGVQP
jgi:hypothetical protein